MNRIRTTHLAAERGAAVPVVMGIMVVLLMLSAAVVGTAQRSSGNAVADQKAKRALGAAEAGLQTAAYRIRKVLPDDTQCMTTVAVAPTAGECPASTPEPVGTGATFSYTVTPTGATCGQLPGYTPPSPNKDRCVTAIGVADGLQRRIQTRVELRPSQPFLNGGVVGMDSVTLTNEVTIDDTDVGSNGLITMTGTPKKVEIKDAAARPHPPGSVVRTGITAITDGIINSTLAYGLSHPDFGKTLPPPLGNGSNNNSQLTTLFGANFNAATRTLNVPSGTWNVPAGTYNLCNWTAAPGSNFVMVDNAAKAAVYLDSPRRTGSGCAPGTGKYLALGNGSSEIKMNNGRPDANITINVWGTTGDASAEDIIYDNKAHIDAVIWAPDSIFRASNDITMHGGVVARKVVMYNQVSAKLDVANAAMVHPGGGPLQRKSWAECTARPPVLSDPESGC